MEQLTIFKANAENKIEELTAQRKQLYGKDDTKDKIAKINSELRVSRKDVRMCDRIMEDVEVVKEYQENVKVIEEKSFDKRLKSHIIK